MIKKVKEESHTMWGGRFSTKPSAVMEEINESISFDQRLAKQDIEGSKAHCQMLAKTGIIAESESAEILKGLDQIRQEIQEGTFTFKTELEDIHMNVEARLKEIIGDTAGKLHTGRSRNDQVAVDFKLWVREALDDLDEHLRVLQGVLIDKAEKHVETLMPGFTHLQVAQPVVLGHHLMAYFEMIKRDRSRIRDARARLNECPLGSAALAGTSFPIDREMTARALGFDRPTTNSLDSVSDRDFAIEYLSVVSICSIHLSRLSEELVVWSSAQFQFVQLSDAFTTGSSIMPQKRNPDAAELIRAKTGRLIGHLNQLLIVMKGLPLAYSKDMQEDKEPVFYAHDIIMLSVIVMTGMIDDMQVRKDKMRKAASYGFSTATDLADWLVRTLKMPFRRAHHVSGQLVKIAEEKQCHLADLPLETMQSIEAGITKDIYTVLTVEASVNSRTSFGGTAPENVKKAIKIAKEEI